MIKEKKLKTKYVLFVEAETSIIFLPWTTQSTYVDWIMRSYIYGSSLCLRRAKKHVRPKSSEWKAVKICFGWEIWIYMVPLISSWQRSQYVHGWHLTDGLITKQQKYIFVKFSSIIVVHCLQSAWREFFVENFKVV